MQRCLDLAVKGLGNVSPNPMVGCVIVKNGSIIGEGYHQAYGSLHAEPEAVNSVVNKSELKGSTVYVSLEPCSHYGKTPPCADLLIDLEVAEVVAGMKDPNPLVAGKGFQKLEAAGIRVTQGILENECRNINKRFLCFFEKKRPYVILKWAETADGFLGSEELRKISSDKSLERLHKWRSEEDAFMVGTETLLKDNPRLNTRLVKGKNPIRVAVDYNLRSEGQNLHFFEQGQISLILNGKRNERRGDIEYIQIENRDPVNLLNALYQRRIQSLVVEGGARLLNSFIKSGLYDEIRVFRSKTILAGHGIKAPELPFNLVLKETIGNDQLFTN
jgi:diaminohydroxyphosphoribosylaminopyrimidine deaminase/5-amino-6-(5-phosphoribosylamino)uracil reductase